MLVFMDAEASVDCSIFNSEVTMISNDMTTPFAAKVLSNRQKSKATKGQRVLVVRFWTGDFGECAIAKVPNKNETQFLSVKNLERIGDATVEEIAEQDAERQAWKDRGNTPVVVGTKPDWESDKSVGFDWTMHRQTINRAGDTCASVPSYTDHTSRKKVRLFFPRSQWDKANGTVPQWLWNKKEEEIRAQYSALHFLVKPWVLRKAAA